MAKSQGTKAPGKQSQATPGAPDIRVAVAAGEEMYQFRVTGTWAATDLSGKKRMNRIGSSRIWRVKRESSRSARFLYALRFSSWLDREDAETVLEEIQERGHDAELVISGSEMIIGSESLDNRIYTIGLGHWETLEEAEVVAEQLESFNCRIIRDKVEDPTGEIEIYDVKYNQHLLFRNGLQLRPTSPDATLSVENVTIYPRTSREQVVNVTLEGVLEIRIENGGMLLLINEVDLESYTAGVLATDTGTDYPLDAMKAKAIAVRTMVLARYGHQYSWQPYDFGFDHEDQAYTGITQLEKIHLRAQGLTRGKVLTSKDRLLEAWLTPVCGGHLEHGSNVLQDGDHASLVGLPDIAPSRRRRKFKDLTVEAEAVEWISTTPNVYCHVQRRDSRDMYEKSHRYFRWEEKYTHRELEELIFRRSGVSLGTLYEVISLKRGVSGRILELELIGSHNSLVLTGERKIRETLGDPYLLSSAFYVEIEYDDLSVPLNFVFHGAGIGSGLGMCETGAGVLAQKGSKYTEILENYYSDVNIRKLYK